MKKKEQILLISFETLNAFIVGKELSCLIQTFHECDSTYHPGKLVQHIDRYRD